MNGGVRARRTFVRARGSARGDPGICLSMAMHGGQGSADVTRIRAMVRRGDNPSHAWVFSVTESQRLRAAGLCLECEDYRYDLSHRWLSRAFLAAERPVGGVTDPQRGLRPARDSAAYSAAESQPAVHLRPAGLARFAATVLDFRRWGDGNPAQWARYPAERGSRGGSALLAGATRRLFTGATVRRRHFGRFAASMPVKSWAAGRRRAVWPVMWPGHGPVSRRSHGNYGQPGCRLELAAVLPR